MQERQPYMSIQEGTIHVFRMLFFIWSNDVVVVNSIQTSGLTCIQFNNISWGGIDRDTFRNRFIAIVDFKP